MEERRNCKRREAMAATESLSSSTATATATTLFLKKMKLDFDYCFEELKLPNVHNYNDDRFFTTHHSPDNNISPATSSNSGCFSTGDLSSTDSVSSSNGDSSALVKNSLTFLDLKVMKSLETESLTCINNKFRRESSCSSLFYGDSEEMESQSSPEVKRSPEMKKKIPSQVEIDEFFAEAEKKEQKRFKQKYNYDIVKDLPLEGRYQWVRLKP